MRFTNLIILLLCLLVVSPPLLAQTGPLVQGQGTFTVYPNGNATFIVPASQNLNVATRGRGNARVMQQVGGPGNNDAPRYQEMTGSPLTNGEVVFGPFTNATTVRVESQVDFVYYSVGANGVSYPCKIPGPGAAVYQLAPVTYSTTTTVLASDILNGIIEATNTSGATEAYTLPTGTLLDAAAGLQINQGVEFTIINLSTSANDTITVTAGSGNTIIGDKVIQIAAQTTGCASARYRSVKTAANTFVTYRVQ